MLTDQFLQQLNFFHIINLLKKQHSIKNLHWVYVNIKILGSFRHDYFGKREENVTSKVIISFVKNYSFTYLIQRNYNKNKKQGSIEKKSNLYFLAVKQKFIKCVTYSYGNFNNFINIILIISRLYVNKYKNVLSYKNLPLRLYFHQSTFTKSLYYIKIDQLTLFYMSIKDYVFRLKYQETIE